jgi:hypothetical protein
MTTIPLLLIQGHNAYVEYQADQSRNCHLALGKAKLPVNKETYDDVQLAGVNGSMEMRTGAEACMLGFDLKGMQPDILPLTQLPMGERLKVTIFGVLVNEYAEGAAEREIQVTATAYGRLNAEIGEFTTGPMGTDFELRSISKYNLVVRTEEMCRWNVKLGGWQSIGGQRTRFNQMLGIVG